ncbi:MAG: sulfite exporter TauE/SafE family protein [Planctomycetota bacterium]
MILAFEGLLAGAAHVLTGPDHLVGVAPLAVEEAAREAAQAGSAPKSKPARIQPWLVGATWGIGHGLGVAIIGVLAQTLFSIAEVEVASGWAEKLVGVLLIGIGLLGIRRSRSLVIHEHRHEHDGSEHVHLHTHDHDHGHRQHGDKQQHRHAAFGIGVVHGLAGAGHFWAVLPSLAMARADAAVYIASYVVASIVLMTAFGAALGSITRRMGTAWMPRFFAAVGALTVGVGAWWLTSNLI